MAKFKPAGLWARISTSFVPKQLKAHVGPEVLPNGQVEVTPLYEIDGYEISPEFVGVDPTQRILGYQVTLDSPAIHIQNKRAGNLHVCRRAKPISSSKNWWNPTFRLGPGMGRLSRG